MKQYIPISEDSENRELFNSYRHTVDNLNSTDYLWKTQLSNGQVFFENDEVYGFVNNQPAVRNRNITITKDYINDFTIRDFRVYSRALNDVITLDINCNLYQYRDGKPHYLYVVLSHNGKYEVYDDMFQSDNTKILFARFIIEESGNARQFYIMLPFSGSADYLKGNQFYQVTDGLRVEVFDKNLKQLTLTDAKIRYSAINFDDKSSPDCIYINHHDNYVPIRYVKWNEDDKIPRVDWKSNTMTTLIQDEVMDYTTGKISKVNKDEWTIQKLYYDVYERCIVVLYGDRAYATREDAIYGIDTVMQYPLPDGIEYLIPIACLLLPNTDEPWTDYYPRIVNLDYNEKEVLDSDTFTRQQSAESMFKSREALAKVNELTEVVNNHTGDRTNPHRVRLDQLYKSDGTAGGLDDSYADTSVSGILQKAHDRAESLYYKKTGGEISGNVNVVGDTTLEKTTVNGELNLGSDVIPTQDNTVSIGSELNKIKDIKTKSLSVSGATKLLGETKTYSVLPNSSGTYSLGSSSYRYSYLYANNVSLSSSLSCYSASISSGLSVGGTSYLTGTVTMANRVSVSRNGYITVGGYSLRLGSTGEIATSTGYALV